MLKTNPYLKYCMPVYSLKDCLGEAIHYQRI